MWVYTRKMSKTCVCTLLRNAARKSSSIYDAALAEVGVTVAQFSLLRKIERHGPSSVTGLARKAELDRSTVGRNVKVLQRMGLMTTSTGDDQREATIVLTDAGRNAITQGAPLWDKAQSQIEDALGEEGVKKLQALLNAI